MNGLSTLLTDVTADTAYYLSEDGGGRLATESGDVLLLEDPPALTYYQLENGDGHYLTEAGDPLTLES